jgi:hypothetical protein
MIYTGIDKLKRYSVACTLDAQGRKLHEARIDGNVPAAFAAYCNGTQGGAKGAAPSEIVSPHTARWRPFGLSQTLAADPVGLAMPSTSPPANLAVNYNCLGLTWREHLFDAVETYECVCSHICPTFSGQPRAEDGQ